MKNALEEKRKQDREQRDKRLIWECLFFLMDSVHGNTLGTVYHDRVKCWKEIKNLEEHDRWDWDEEFSQLREKLKERLGIKE